MTPDQTPPVERKVTAATIGATIAGAVVWAAQTWVFHGVLPAPIENLLTIGVPALVALIAGYLAPHTHRTDLPDPRVSELTEQLARERARRFAPPPSPLPEDGPDGSP